MGTESKNIFISVLVSDLSNDSQDVHHTSYTIVLCYGYHIRQNCTKFTIENFCSIFYE